jgi:hypothetical protein
MDNKENSILLGLEAGTMLERPELAFLYDLALNAPDGIGVECGVARGGSLLCWAGARASRGPILAVDNQILDVWTVARDNLARWGPDIVYLVGNSWELGAMLVQQQHVAFSFIDACHKEAGVGRDVEVWPRATKAAGVIVFHDYAGAKKYDVTRCVDRWQATARWEYLGQVGITIGFRRPE